MADKLTDAVKKFADDLAKKMETFVGDVTTLEVRTYTTPADQIVFLATSNPDIETLMKDGKVLLRAYTIVSFDGDTSSFVPVNAEGEVDKTLWDLHQEMVTAATATRATMIKTIGDAATSALGAVHKTNE